MKDYPIKLGTMLFTLVEPHRGHEVEYNRWYERDHFYAGCLVGEYNFAGRRFVATRRLKDLRPTEANPITPDPATGSYLAIYWILADHHDDWNRWAFKQVHELHANDRMFAERDHIHTLLYRYDWGLQRDPDGVSAELALDHHFPGMVTIFGEAAEGVDRAEVDAWYRDAHLAGALDGSPVALVLSFSPLPLLGEAPGVKKSDDDTDRRFLQLHFLDADPSESWSERYAEHGAELEASGKGRLLWSSPFIPTVVGTDTYTDELW